jgi:hypothetical protein
LQHTKMMAMNKNMECLRDEIEGLSPSICDFI